MEVPVNRDSVDRDRHDAWAQCIQLVGTNVRELRMERGLTQESLALESGVSRNQLIHLEHGRRGLLFERLADLAKVLNVPVGDLFFESTPRDQ